MAQASRSKGKARSRPIRQRVARTGRLLRGTTALPRSAGRSTCWRRCRASAPRRSRPWPTQARCTRTAGFPPAAHPGGPRLRHPGRGTRDVAARCPLGRAWPRGRRAGRARGDRHAVPGRAGQDRGENVYLRVRDGLESETIAIYQADPGLRIYSEVGKRQPLHAGSSRMLLAHAPEAVQTQVLAQRLPRFTPATRTDAAWIAADLQRIRDPRLPADHGRSGRRRRHGGLPGARRVGPGGGGTVGQRAHHADAPAAAARPAADGAGRRDEALARPGGPNRRAYGQACRPCQEGRWRCRVRARCRAGGVCPRLRWAAFHLALSRSSRVRGGAAPASACQAGRRAPVARSDRSAPWVGPMPVAGAAIPRRVYDTPLI